MTASPASCSATRCSGIHGAGQGISSDDPDHKAVPYVPERTSDACDRDVQCEKLHLPQQQHQGRLQQPGDPPGPQLRSSRRPVSVGGDGDAGAGEIEEDQTKRRQRSESERIPVLKPESGSKMKSIRSGRRGP